MSLELKNQNLTGSIDVHTQVHLDSITVDNQSGLTIYNGIAWSQTGSINSVEYRINGGEWNSVAFEATNGSLAALERFDWSIALDTDKLPRGNNTLEFRGLSDDGQSLPVIITVTGKGDSNSHSEPWYEEFHLDFIFVVLFLIVGLLLWFGKTSDPEPLMLDSNESIDKVLKDDLDIASVVDAELLEG